MIREIDIQKTCTQFLELDGWRALRTDPVSDKSRAKGFGEVGMADMLYIRYLADPAKSGHKTGCPCCCGPLRGQVFAQVLWIEYKRERGGNGKRGLFTRAEKAKIHQKAWHAAERARGALTLIAGEEDGFPATIEGFISWYQASGLQRKRITLGAVRGCA